MVGEATADRPLVVAVLGSPRRRSNSTALVEVVLDALRQKGAACEAIQLSRLSIAPCLAYDTCGELAACPQRDDAAEVLRRVFAADCLLLGTPVYYENVSAQMKAFMDRSLFPYAHGETLRARAVGLVAVTAETGLTETLDALRRYVALSSGESIPTFTCGGYADEAGAAQEDAGLVAQARRLAGDLAGALGLTQA